jgi:uncharacterized caspase-like protein
LGRLLLIAVFAWIFAGLSVAQAAESRIALVIGNGDYKAITPLRNPINDARLMRRTLQDQLGFEVIYVEDADQAAMDRAIVRFGARLAEAGAGAIAMFYYAGHGVQSGGENFLLPVDIAISREADLPLRAVRAEDVLRQMEAAPSAVKVVILDACRDNPFGARFKMAAAKGLADIALGNTEFTIGYAATAGRAAEDGDNSNSPYATALARHLPAAGKEIFEVFRLVRYDVAEATGGRQLPEARTTMLRQLYLNRPGAGVEVASAAPLVAAPARAATPFDLKGRWCQAGRSAGAAFTMTITDSDIQYDLGETKARYGVRSIGATDAGALQMHWLNKQTPMVFEFGEFSSDGRSMTQLRGRDEIAAEWKTYDRRFQRC